MPSADDTAFTLAPATERVQASESPRRRLKLPGAFLSLNKTLNGAK